jgi:hypothetical protein
MAENEMMDTLACAACGRSLAEAFAWKGNGERYYCNDFCAEAEEAESPALVPKGQRIAGKPAITGTITPPGARNP